MTEKKSRTVQHWDEAAERFRGKDLGVSWWEAGPEIARYINRRVSGQSDVDWIDYTLDKYFNDGMRSGRHLSLGCGSGGLERSLARRGAFRECDAFDLSPASIAKAREEAARAGIGNIEYSVADVNRINLQPHTYDAVWIHAAMHHFGALEYVCEQVCESLTEDGIMILQEYIGPDRFQFPGRQKEIANLCLQLLPTRYRVQVPAAVERQLERSSMRKQGARRFMGRLLDKIRDGDLSGAVRRRLNIYTSQINGKPLQKTRVDFPTRQSVVATDPSEAVRSSEIVPVVQKYFSIIERKDWGGNILQFLLSGIAGNFADDGEESRALLRMLITIEETLLECGEYESDFAYFVAQPRGK